MRKDMTENPEEVIETKIRNVLKVFSRGHVSGCLMHIGKSFETIYKKVYRVNIEDRYAYSYIDIVHLYGDTFIANDGGSLRYFLMDIRDIFDIESGYKKVRHFLVNGTIGLDRSNDFHEIILGQLLRRGFNARFNGSYMYIDDILYLCIDTKKFYVISNMVINDILLRKDNRPHKISHGFFDVSFVFVYV